MSLRLAALNLASPTPRSAQAQLAWLAGLDVGFEDNGATTRAAAVLLDATTLQPVAQEMARQRFASAPASGGVKKIRPMV